MKTGKSKCSNSLLDAAQRCVIYSSLFLMSTGTVLAQDSTDAGEQDSGEGVLEEVIITGSRIERTGMTTSQPVTMVSSDDLELIAPGDLIEGMNTLPQFFASQTPNSADSWFLRGGYGMLNLRGLGINRTLTLLDGRRMTSSTAFGGVDINLIPEAVIKRVETVTGGASAAYGTDAVAGVVNFILDHEFEGFDVHAQTGTTAESDADNWEASATFGTEIGSAGHIVVSMEQAETDGVDRLGSRDWYRAWGLVPDATGMLVRHPDVVSRNSTFNGLIIAPGSSLHGMEFNSSGTAVSPFQTSSVSGFPLGAPPARHSITNGGSGDDLGQYSNINQIWPETGRKSAFVYGDWDFSDNVTVFGQYIYGENQTDRGNSPGGSYQGTPTALTIFADNAFLPQSIRDTMAAEGVQSFNFKRMGSPWDTMPESRIWDDNESNTWTVGVDVDLEGGFFDSWNLSAYYQNGESDRKGYQKGLRVDRIFAAIDAVDDGNGNIVCRTTLFSDAFAGCTPLNLFGTGNASAAAIDYVTGFEPGQSITTPVFFADDGFASGQTYSYVTGDAKVNHAIFEQDLFEIAANGPIADGWGAGPISLAVGYAYRKEEILQLVQDVTNPASDHSGNFRPVSCNDPSIGLRGVSVPDCLNTVGVQYSKVSNIKGDSDVSEFFAETYIPIVGGAEHMQQMTANLAARWADYSGSGTIWAYKGGVDMQFNDSWRLRATYSRDVRAANMSERFDKTGGSTTVNDPAFGGENYTVTFFSGGNPAVNPEEADTYTVGLVWQPGFTEGLQMSLDWYRIDIADAIGQLGVQAMVNNCYAGSAEACQYVTRNPADNRLVLVGNVFVNVAQSAAEGVDFEMDYARSVNWLGGGNELFTARMFVTYLKERSEQLVGAAKIDRAGQTGFQQSDGLAYALPDYKINGFLTYTNGGWGTFLQARYIADGTYENSLVEGVNIESNKVGSALYFDANLSYTWEFGDGDTLQLFGNITNLTNEDPPPSPYFSAFYGYTQQTNNTLFDVLGRRYTVGARVRFW